MQPKNRTNAPAEDLSLEDRLVRLEGAVRRWRWLCTILVVPVVVLSGMTGWALWKPRTLRAAKFECVNERGITVATLDATRMGGHLDVRNSEGKHLVLAAADGAGDGTLQTYNSKGIAMVGIHTTPTGGAVQLFNNLGREVVGLQSNKANCGAVLVRDLDGATRESLSGSRRF